MNNKLTRIVSISEINTLKRNAKAHFSTLVSNWTIFPDVVKKWIDSGSLYYMESANGFFLVHVGSRVNELFFFFDCFDNVTNSLREIEINNGKPLILEIISKDSKSPLKINPLMILNRMSAVEFPTYRKLGKYTPVLSSNEDINEIEKILLNNFNPEAERIPSKEALMTYVIDQKTSGIYLVKEKDKIIGLMMFSKDPSTIHLKYWWTDRSKWGLGIGGSLLNEFFKEANGCKRMILWVNKDNINAIEKYIHYGFSSENLYDYIYSVYGNL